MLRARWHGEPVVAEFQPCGEIAQSEITTIVPPVTTILEIKSTIITTRAIRQRGILSD